MKRLIFSGLVLIGLAGCNYDPYYTQECTLTVDDGYHMEPYQVSSYHPGGYHRSGYYSYHTSYHMVHRTHCGRYVQICHPGKKDGKTVPCPYGSQTSF